MEQIKEKIAEFIDWARDCGEDVFYIFDNTEEAIKLFISQKNLSNKSFIINTDDTFKKPPLGLVPKRFSSKQSKVERFNEISEAISRYTEAKLEINIEWIEEYNQLIKQINKT